MNIRWMWIMALWGLLGGPDITRAAEESAFAIPPPIQVADSDCDISMEEPHYFVKGNYSVGDRSYKEKDKDKTDHVCGHYPGELGGFEFPISYYLTDDSLMPNEASKYLLFSVSIDIGLENALHGRHITDFERMPDGRVEFSSPLDGSVACSTQVIRNEVSEISGPNWHGWIAEKVYSPLPKSKRSLPYCQVYTRKYRCTTLLIGNDKMSVTGYAHDDIGCLLRKSDHSLYKAVSYDTYLQMIKSIRLRE